MSSEILKGYETILDRLKEMIADEDWTFFGIIDYDYTEIEDKFIITPENMLLALADFYNKKFGKNVLVILNYNRPGKYNLRNPEQLEILKNIVDRYPNMHLMEFSYNNLNIGEKVRVNIGNIIEIREILAQALAKISERTNYVNPKRIKFSTISSFSNFLIKITGPPSVLDDLKKRAQDYVGKMGGPKKFIARMISITRLIEAGLTGAAGFYKVLKLHYKDEEYKAWLKKIEEESRNIYNVEKLSSIFLEEYGKFYEGINIVVTDLFDRYYGFTIALLILEFLKLFSGSFVILGDIPDPEHYEPLATWFPTIITTYDAKLGVYVASRYYPTTEKYAELLRRLVTDKSMIFNLKSDFFHILHSGESVIVYSWLYEKFSQIEGQKREGEYMFIFHDEKRELPWTLMSVSRGIIERFKGFFRR